MLNGTKLFCESSFVKKCDKNSLISGKTLNMYKYATDIMIFLELGVCEMIAI